MYNNHNNNNNNNYNPYHYNHAKSHNDGTDNKHINSIRNAYNIYAPHVNKNPHLNDFNHQYYHINSGNANPNPNPNPNQYAHSLIINQPVTLRMPAFQINLPPVQQSRPPLPPHLLGLKIPTLPPPQSQPLYGRASHNRHHNYHAPNVRPSFNMPFQSFMNQHLHQPIEFANTEQQNQQSTTNQLDEVKTQNAQLIEKFYAKTCTLVDEEFKKFNDYLKTIDERPLTTSDKPTGQDVLIRKKVTNSELNKLKRLKTLIELNKKVDVKRTTHRRHKRLERTDNNDNKNHDDDDKTRVQIKRENYDNVVFFFRNKNAYRPVLQLKSNRQPNKTQECVVYLTWHVLDDEARDLTDRSERISSIIREYEIYGFKEFEDDDDDQPMDEYNIQLDRWTLVS